MENPLISNKYLDSCLFLSQNIKNMKYEGLSLYMKGYNYITLGKIDSAKTNLNQSIKIANKYKIPEILYESYRAKAS